ncbi:hypothetical protein IMG5_051630 [Ichthyophthirius multifiliis]|uniref:EF-hand domain-containing protein n=1 Tax=Ichthyophthirius multifiliis TaxID=5932 RepID=G0QMT2_ICHMU|nr:hypothetical protein IMG5_051630 [Ichthyophthirius multifiliis]EGR33485.1 hypothetical protein IMG5_051630 [Ichthyophthirius multifiliis]|eukprot:XP_004037471.1 hypothetical protein IMG5_051630 [Ichthyophthirius multifiliis]
MISAHTQSRLANVFQSISDGEQKTEVFRQVLAEQKSFEPYASFCRLDIGKKGYLISSDLQQFLQQNQIYATLNEIQNIIFNLSSTIDGRLAYSNFAEGILPQEDRRLKQLVNLRESYYIEDGQTLPYESEWALVRVFEQEIKNLRNTENLKKILQRSLDFNKLNCFNSIDRLGLGYLDIQSIDEFMTSCDQALNEEQLVALFRKLRSSNCQITYTQFVQIISLNNEQNIQQSSPSKLSQYTPQKNDSHKKDFLYQSYLQRSASLEKSRNINNFCSQQLNQPRNRYSSTNKKQENSLYRINNNGLKESSLLQNKSPLKQNEEEQLVKALKQQIVLDRDLEDLKNQLALRRDFNIEDAFRIIDQNGRGFVSKIEFESALNKIGIFPSKNELFLFFQRYDKDNDGLLQYSEFNDLISPQNFEFAYLSKSREPLYCDPENGLFNFSTETRRIFQKLMNKIFLSEVEAEIIRQQLNIRPLFSVYNAFQAIDNLDSGFITLQNFKQILNDYGIFVCKDDLKSLVKRYDKNEDFKITYKEFINELMPKSPLKQY